MVFALEPKRIATTNSPATMAIVTLARGEFRVFWGELERFLYALGRVVEE